jgi:non-lysosomal glucosylceramidase
MSSKIVLRVLLIVSLVTFLSTGNLSFGETSIPSVAWSRDVNAGGFLDGAPIGGFGAGTITWRFDGNFYKGRLDIGFDDFIADENCGFYMYQKPFKQTVFSKKLTGGSLGSGQATYYALFPKAWVDYSGNLFTCKAKVTQFSPIIPGDYQRTSYPVGIYQWEITNPTDKACEVAVMFTWNNTLSGVSAEAVASGDYIGLKLKREGANNAEEETQGEFTLATQQSKGVTVTYASATDINGLQKDFSADGLLNKKIKKSPIGGIAFKTVVGPGQTVVVPIVMAWDIPIAQFGLGGNKWYKKYTRFFGRSGLNSWNIAKEALENYATWEKSIDEWQNGIIKNNAYPNWLKTCIFNELYYYFTGGTMWEAGAASGQADNPDEDMFSHLECYDYALYGTSDVRFYGSWPLILLWPELDKQAVRQFSDSVYNTRKDRPVPMGTCAHDFGGRNSVFAQWNAYTYRNTQEWKDLNSKLVLMVYRDWVLTGKKDTAFLNYSWIPVQKAMAKVKSQDPDNDGLPNSHGIDQTYDEMDLQGNTSYCGSLFLAACEAAKEIALALGDKELAKTYQTWFDLGKASFESKLWNGKYYNIDTDSAVPTRIMSDQLCGQWYAKACGLPGIVSSANAISAFTTLYNYNFKQFGDGTHGIVNVMKPDGVIDTSTGQANEAWVGTSWGVVAGMIQEGMYQEAEEIGYSIYNTIWNTNEMWFRTPEAWTSGIGSVRGYYYMRANCIWAVKHAYDISPNVK